MSRPDRRTLRDRPYLSEHLASQRATEPRGFAGLLRWFLEGFSAETPERIHVPGVWFGRPAHDGADVASYDPASGAVLAASTVLVGGSQLGAPKVAEPFRQLIENSPRQAIDDGPCHKPGCQGVHFVRPMRAAIARLAANDDGAFMGRFLAQVAYAGGDWRAVSERWFPRTPWVRRAWAEHSLRRLYRVYRAEPPATHVDLPTWIEKSDAQRAAELAAAEGNGHAA